MASEFDPAKRGVPFPRRPCGATCNLRLRLDSDTHIRYKLI